MPDKTTFSGVDHGKVPSKTVITFAVEFGSETDLDLRYATQAEVDGILYTITSRDTRRVMLGTDRERKTYAFYTCETP